MFLHRRPGIPSSDVTVLRRVSLRTRAVRWLLVVLVCGLAAAALVSARDLDPRKSDLVPGGTSGVVVLDLSLSITSRDYSQVRGVLQRLIAAGRPMGLVVFSDIPYELVPPRTPARELRPILRLFTPVADRLPRTPWAQSFQAGTTISTALRLAQGMLRRDGVSHGSIILFSDLETAPSDFTNLGRTIASLRRSTTTVRVVALSPSSDSLNLFQSLLGRDAFVNPVEPRDDTVRLIQMAPQGQVPLALLVFSVLVFLALAAHERFTGQLAVPSGKGRTTS